MSQCSRNTASFIKSLYGPKVAVLCSQDVDIISRRNNLAFCDLIQPFSIINQEIPVHDPTGIECFITDLHISAVDIHFQYPNESSVKQLLSDVVNEASNKGDYLFLTEYKSGDRQITFSKSQPWFEAYRDVLTSNYPPKPHEYINSCTACMLVVSTCNPNPLDEFAKLSQQQNHIQHNSQNTNLRWMTNNTLKYYVLLHDVQLGDINKSETILTDLQSMYGIQNCRLLQINSRSKDDDHQIPDPWSRLVNNKPKSNSTSSSYITFGKENGVGNLPEGSEWIQNLQKSCIAYDNSFGCCLTLADHDHIQKLMFDFASGGLIPHIEKTIRVYSEQIASRKAIHKSLFRATRMFFGSNKATSAPALKTYNTGGVEPPELQVRKIADLYFLCQMYDLAYNHYHSAKKDFSNEQAWLHAAGAAEMAALSNFMQMRSQRAYPSHYVESSLETYIATCNDQYLPLRCVFVSLACLSDKGSFMEAAMQLLRITNEDDDLRSAILLEQVAQCFLNTKTPLLRKFTFHIVLAGHRYGKSGQRTCALHCYKSALQMYDNTDWALAKDHINFTIARQSFNLQKLDVASNAFELLLHDSKQSPAQQANFLQEYLHTSNKYAETTNTLTQLKIPTLCPKKCVINPTSSSADIICDKEWQNLEDYARTERSKEKSGVKIGGTTHSALGEIVVVDVCVTNTLLVPLVMTNVSMLYDFNPDDDQNNPQCAIDVKNISEVTISENCETYIRFDISSKQLGEIKITGLQYTIMINTQINSPVVELDGQQRMLPEEYITMKIGPAMPKLEINVVDFPSNFLCGEIRSAKVVLKNIGKQDMKNIRIAFHSSVKCLLTNPDSSLKNVQQYFLSNSENKIGSFCGQSILNDGLHTSNESESMLWLQSPPESGEFPIGILIYYEASGSETSNYRVLKYANTINTTSSLLFNAGTTWQSNRKSAHITVSAKNENQRQYLFQLKQLICESAQWDINSFIDQPLAYLDAGQSIKLYLNAKEASESEMKQQKLQSIPFENDDVEASINDFEEFRKLVGGLNMKEQNNDHLTFAIQWLSDLNGVCQYGQHYCSLTELSHNQNSLSGLGIGDNFDPNNSESLSELHQLVKWEMEFTQEKRHDFKKSGLCLLPVKIILQNLADCTLQVKIDGLDLAPSTQPQSTHFLWCGKALSYFLLPSKGTHTVTMNACFSFSGIYNLNTFSVWAIPTNIENHIPLLPQTCQFSSMATIINSPSHSDNDK